MSQILLLICIASNTSTSSHNIINTSLTLIHSIQDLIEAREELTLGSTTGLRVDDKSKLLAFIQWRIANPDVGINDDVVESAIEKYMSEEVLSPTVDKEWNHICLTVGIPNGSRKKLEMQGISSLDSLMQVSCLKVRSCCLFLIALWFFTYLSHWVSSDQSWNQIHLNHRSGKNIFGRRLGLNFSPSSNGGSKMMMQISCKNLRTKLMKGCSNSSVS